MGRNGKKDGDRQRRRDGKRKSGKKLERATNGKIDKNMREKESWRGE